VCCLFGGLVLHRSLSFSYPHTGIHGEGNRWCAAAKGKCCSGSGRAEREAG
jgi:hypothetical protein